MNYISLKSVSLLLSLAALTIVSNTMPVRGETSSNDSSVKRSEPVAVQSRVVKPAVTSAATVNSSTSNFTSSVSRSKSTAVPSRTVEPAATPVVTVDPLASDFTSSGSRSEPGATAIRVGEPAATPVVTVDPLAIHPSVTPIPHEAIAESKLQKALLAELNRSQADSQMRQPEVMHNNQQTSSDAANSAAVAKPPIPGTLATSATLLAAPPKTSPQLEISSERTNSTTVAQDEIRPGQATRGGSSYIGIGGNIGFTGDTASGSGAFVVNSKIGLTRSISVRPSVLISDDVDFLIPVTYDFTIESTDPFAPVPFAPFLGGGVAFSTNDEDNFGFLVTGGVDVPLSREFVANAAINAAFIEGSTNVGIVIGVGYTFPNFRR